jgi:tRNA(fMet)-specific endonuclease VapC
MGGRYLLDSNIAVAFLNGDPNVRELVDKADEIYLPAIALGELYYGAFNSSRKPENLEKIDGFKDEVYLLDCDEYTAKIYGQVKKGLKDKGTPIPENDIWISAIAIQYGLTVVTRDSHFDYVDGLNIESW